MLPRLYRVGADPLLVEGDEGAAAVADRPAELAEGRTFTARSPLGDRSGSVRGLPLIYVGALPATSLTMANLHIRQRIAIDGIGALPLLILSLIRPSAVNP